MIQSNNDIIYFLSEKPNTLSDILNTKLSVELNDFNFLLNMGAIYVNNERQTKNKYIKENSQLRIHIKPRRFNCDFNWRSLIIYENDFCLVLNKPHGIPCHPTVDNYLENSLTQLSLTQKYPLFVTHRLDTLTSGLIVYAKKNSFVTSFNKQLQERTINKKYVALVESQDLFTKNIVHYMNPASGVPKILSDKAIKNWPVCRLEIIDQKKVTDNLSWLKINLLTGRTHQIRAQLSYLNAPIAGDSLYGANSVYINNSIALKSVELEFKCNEEIIKLAINSEFEFN